MGELLSSVVLGPYQQDEERVIIINEHGIAEELPPDRYWEINGDTMHYTPQQTEGEQ